MNRYNFLGYVLIMFFAFFGGNADSYEDMTKYKGEELANKLYSRLQVHSYQMNIEFKNNVGDVRIVKTLFLEPNYLNEYMSVVSSKNETAKDENLSVICDGKILWVTIKSVSMDVFQFIETDKVKEKGIDLKDFYRSYSMANLFSFSRIFKNPKIIRDSWEIIGKKQIDSKECYEIKVKFKNEKGELKEDVVFVGCEDGIPRFPGIKILSYLPYAPLTPANFKFIPPRDKVPADATKIAIDNYYASKKRDEKSDNVISIPQTQNMQKKSIPEKPAGTKKPDAGKKSEEKKK